MPVLISIKLGTHRAHNLEKEMTSQGVGIEVGVEVGVGGIMKKKKPISLPIRPSH